ncbi:MAG: hypothetical protein C5S47_08155 [Candidatus Methanogasteraceae archaeon]|nr:MAG: hypothetical protein C5S47_08155 [ANME-2 cluster archaeon]
MGRVGDALSNGAHTWKQNPILCVPFLLDALAEFAFFMLVLAGVAIAIGTEALMEVATGLSELVAVSQSYSSGGAPSIETMFEIVNGIYHSIVPFIGVYIAASVILVIGCALISSFFESGAIGMAKTATETGVTGMQDLFYSGRKSAIDLFLANIAIVLIILAGIAFLVPGALLLRTSGESMLSAAAIFVGFIMLSLYMIILGIGLLPVKYALVVDHLGAIEGINRGWSFFSCHKLDVLVMFFVMFVIYMLLGMIENIFYVTPITAQIWQFVGWMINVCVIMPLIAVWWTRLYIMSKA